MIVQKYEQAVPREKIGQSIGVVVEKESVEVTNPEDIRIFLHPLVTCLSGYLFEKSC